MERSVFVLLVLVLISLCKGLTTPYFCPIKPCPEFVLLETNHGFETRLYNDMLWITTKIESDDVMAAHSKLKDFCERQRLAGYTIPDAWPVLITVIDDDMSWLSWFVPNGTAVASISDPYVTQETRPGGTVYVRKFSGYPSRDSGLQNAKKLCEDLTKAQKKFNANTFYGAGYEPIWSVIHHNEIWISAV
ncbi:heme-binding protein 2-like [Dunckerocampus dactyliophorus]|uniref:heme-binding protein 2-like n=1 Tax=Dunckerocampus dactyliophorus TaxID=161453 RepID=UPI002405950E|nr:heme-binding protein 2-like [Dunckerocampus dactyliophorus]XP_054654996.1 heme-binding protein 2-like [Dunckerocampus dactyliophorus]